MPGSSGAQRRGQRPATLSAYVLGLADRFRGTELLAQLAGYGVRAVHVPALDAVTLSPAELAAIYDSAAARWVDRELGPSEVACAYGHLAMMRAFLLTDSAWALFLEDDAALLRDPTTLVDALACGPATPTVVHLQAAGLPSHGARRLLDSEGCRIWAVRAPPDRTVGYLANRALARLATQAYRDHRIDSTADWPIRWRYDAQFAVCEPPLVGHPGSDSSIEGERNAAQATGIHDKGTRLARLAGAVSGLRLVAARRHGYPSRLVLRLDVVSPLARITRRSMRVLGRR